MKEIKMNYNIIEIININSIKNATVMINKKIYKIIELTELNKINTL